MRFHTLDGMRGFASLVVLAYHIIQQRFEGALPFAGLAVDFFYVLSGFVVAYSYESRLATQTVSLREFAVLRFRRLYPLAFFGILIGVMLAVAASLSKGSMALSDIAQAAALAFLLLPSFVFRQWPTAYPFNMAAWSLTFEALANVLFAAIARYLSLARLIAIVVFSAMGLIWLAFALGGIAGGNNQANVVYGIPRVLFPFFAGVLLRRLPMAPVTGALGGTGMMALLLAALLCSTGWGAFSSLAMVLILFPLLVWFGTSNRPGALLERVFGFLGALSYPLYITQAPVLRLGLEVLRSQELTAAQFALFAIAEGGGALALAWFAMRYVDAPLQRLFRGKGSTSRMTAGVFAPAGYRSAALQD